MGCGAELVPSKSKCTKYTGDDLLALEKCITVIHTQILFLVHSVEFSSLLPCIYVYFDRAPAYVQRLRSSLAHGFAWRAAPDSSKRADANMPWSRTLSSDAVTGSFNGILYL